MQRYLPGPSSMDHSPEPMEMGHPGQAAQAHADGSLPPRRVMTISEMLEHRESPLPPICTGWPSYPSNPGLGPYPPYPQNLQQPHSGFSPAPHEHSPPLGAQAYDDNAFRALPDPWQQRWSGIGFPQYQAELASRHSGALYPPPQMYPLSTGTASQLGTQQAGNTYREQMEHARTSAARMRSPTENPAPAQHQPASTPATRTFSPIIPSTSPSHTPVTPQFRFAHVPNALVPEPQVVGREYGFLQAELNFPHLFPYRTMDVLSLPLVDPTTATENQQEPTNNLRTCIICMEKIDKEQFPHSCFRCENGNMCTGCLKSWFLDACKNESKMPPKCCSPIPLATARNLLTVAEVELYKAKYEEWSTPDRIYCPVPTCSTFISPKTYTESAKPVESSLLPADWQAIDVSQESEQAKSPEPATKNVKPRVACPKCFTSICTKCRSFTHIGDCKENDLEPELAAALKKWRIKRCPKCRAGVRRMFGCAHIECRCGAHFCWVCLSSIATCGGGCEDDAYDEEDEDDGIIAEDDVDGLRGYEGDGNQFGMEPRNENGGAWGCHHYWHPAYRPDAANQEKSLECHRCFQEIPPATLAQFTAYQESQKPPAPEPMNTSGQPAWQCAGKHLTCDVCSKIGPFRRMDDPTRLWSCECGKKCDECESFQKVVADEKETKNDYAWHCNCGMTLCGGCKEMEE